MKYKRFIVVFLLTGMLTASNGEANQTDPPANAAELYKQMYNNFSQSDEDSKEFKLWMKYKNYTGQWYEDGHVIFGYLNTGNLPTNFISDLRSEIHSDFPQIQLQTLRLKAVKGLTWGMGQILAGFIFAGNDFGYLPEVELTGYIPREGKVSVLLKDLDVKKNIEDVLENLGIDPDNVIFQQGTMH